MTYLRFSASSVEIKWDGIERTQSASAIGLVFLGGGGDKLASSQKLIPAPTGSC